MIQKERIKVLNKKEMKKGAYVLYLMQASQRAEYNHALEYTIMKANELRQPIIVFFGITDHFPELRNDPTLDYLSHMSPYLHFGQISPLYIAPKVLKTGSPGVEAFLEELIIRRELSMNFVFYNEKYDSLDAIPEWSKKTLRTHQKDKCQSL